MCAGFVTQLINCGATKNYKKEEISFNIFFAKIMR